MLIKTTVTKYNEAVQALTHPVPEIDTNVSIEFVQKRCSRCINKIMKLELFMSGMPYFKPLYFDENSLGCEGITNKHS